MTKVIGITGGIGSGKSTFSKYLKKNGFLVHESDQEVSNLYREPDKKFLEFLKKLEIKDSIKNNKINKKTITKIIFYDQKLRNKIEKYIHKVVGLNRENFIKKNSKSKEKVIFIDIPLLFEKKLERNFDLVVSIISTRKNRVRRVLKNNKFSRELLKKILKLQTTDKERKLKSNIIINNNKTKKDFISRAEKVLRGILK